MTIEKTYHERLKDFTPKENSTCQNYVRAIEFAKTNGYVFSKDVSYNGYIFFEKVICEAEHPLDGHKLEIQVYDDIKMTKNPQFCLYEKEADFGQSILSETRYYYKSVSRSGGFNSKNLNELFSLALKTEKELVESYKQMVQ